MALGNDLPLASDLADRLPVILVCFDEQKRIFLWNRSAEEISGMSRTEAIGADVTKLEVGPSYESAALIVERLFAGAFWEGEIETRRRLGGPIPVHYRCWPLRDANGVVIGGIAAGLDASELRRSETALRSSEERLRLVVQSMPVLLAAFDERGCIVAWNRECERVTGYTAVEMIGDPQATGLLYPDTATRRRWLEADAPDRPWGFDAELTCKDGGLRAVSWANLSARVAVPGWVRWHVGIDVTEQRRAERDYRVAIETALDGFAVTDGAGVILDVNESLSTILGYSRAELLGMRAGTFDASEPAEHARNLAELFATGRVRFESRYRRKDGRLLDVDVTIGAGSAARDRFFAFVRDVSQKHRLEEQFRQAQKMEAVGRLAGGIAHDFNNLLTAIGGYAALVDRKLLPDDPRRHDVAEIRRAAERATALTRQLLAFSRKQVLRPRVVDINAIVADLEKMLRRLIGEDVAVELRLRPPSLVNADPSQIEQVLMNLAVNARDAMPDGGSLTIEVSEMRRDEAVLRDHIDAKPGPYVLLTVRDTGVGMDETTLSHLFEPFFTTKEQGKGTGLGLATVYGIVTQSGGHIEVDSAPGRGTTFRIYLPAARSSASAVETRLAARRDPRGNERLLLVEDESNVRALAARILRDHGYTVLEAGDGPAALERIEADSLGVDLLVTDIVMPRMSGPLLAEELCRRRPGLPVLYISGHSEEAVLDQAAGQALEPLLLKPFAPDALVEKVREVLDRAHAERRTRAPQTGTG